MPNIARDASMTSHDSDDAGSVNGGKSRVKRKKASRACLHCQKAHLTCDDARPCGRCVKRGLQGSCHDGVRKKAKYLQDVEIDDLYNGQGNETPGPVQTATHATQTAPPIVAPVISYETPTVVDYAQRVPPPPPAGLSTQSTDPAIFSAPQTVNLAAMSMDGQANGLFDDTFLFDYPPLSSYDFDSKAANLEYSMISTMLGRAMTPVAELNESYAMSPQGLRPNAHFNGAMHAPAKAFSAAGSPSTGHPLQQQHTPHSQQPHRTGTLPHDIKYDMPSPATSNQSYGSQHSRSQPAAPSTYVDPHGQRPTPVARRAVAGAGKDPASIYKAITRPFSYTNGYHLLNSYLRNRFDKEDLVRIARAIVGYRPSFIALTKTLREEDLTFMEVCFQRTLLEYEKFVGYSGTPTVVWRRTGQIEMVGKEFCLLTGWSRDALLGKQTFIVELMDDASVVEYFEQFSQHAFGDTSSVVTTATLKTPTAGSTVACAFCFTVKRDVFDIPMMIVGNFLPCLS